MVILGLYPCFFILSCVKFVHIEINVFENYTWEYGVVENTTNIILSWCILITYLEKFCNFVYEDAECWTWIFQAACMTIECMVLVLGVTSVVLGVNVLIKCSLMTLTALCNCLGDIKFVFFTGIIFMKSFALFVLGWKIIFKSMWLVGQGNWIMTTVAIFILIFLFYKGTVFLLFILLPVLVIIWVVLVIILVAPDFFPGL